MRSNESLKIPLAVVSHNALDQVWEAAQLEGEVFSSPVAWNATENTATGRGVNLRVAVGCRDNHVYCYHCEKGGAATAKLGMRGLLPLEDWPSLIVLVTIELL